MTVTRLPVVDVFGSPDEPGMYRFRCAHCNRIGLGFYSFAEALLAAKRHQAGCAVDDDVDTLDVGPGAL